MFTNRALYCVEPCGSSFAEASGGIRGDAVLAARGATSETVSFFIRRITLSKSVSFFIKYTTLNKQVYFFIKHITLNRSVYFFMKRKTLNKTSQKVKSWSMRKTCQIR